MKKLILISALLFAFISIKAQTVLDRILTQGKAPFNSTTWVDTLEEKFYYNSLGLAERRTATDLRASTPFITLIDTNTYDSAKRLINKVKYYKHRGATSWSKGITEEYTYNGNLLVKRLDTTSWYRETIDFVYNTDSTLKEMVKTESGGNKIKTTYFYNSSKQLTHSFRGNKSRKDSFVYVGNQLKERISYEWRRWTTGWDSSHTYSYTYNTDGTLKEKIERYHIPGTTYDNYRYQYFYKTLSTSLNEVEASNLVKIYPNPSSGRFTVELDNAEPSTITITDITGKQVYNAKASSDLDVDLTILQKGIYLVNIKSGATSSTERIVIQ